MDNYIDNPVSNFVEKSVNNQLYAQNSTINNQILVENIEWVNYWIRWLIEHYQLHHQDQEQINLLIKKIFFSLSQGHSAILVSEKQCQCLGQACAVVDKTMNFPYVPFIYDGEYLALYRYALWELQLAKVITQFVQGDISIPVDQAKIEAMIQQLNPQDQYQKQALLCAVSYRLTLITGGPGTGKTFTLAQVIVILNQLSSSLRIGMAAPTGKAAQRMQEALQKALSYLPQHLVTPQLKQQSTMTLHRLLGITGQQQQAKYHAKHPLPYDVIVIDEASMLDLNLARLLFMALPAHCRLILLGDAHQLASVDVGSVLADLQELSILKPYCQQLVHSRRFNQESKIGQSARFLQQYFGYSFDNTEHITSCVQGFLQLFPVHQFNYTTLTHDKIQYTAIETTVEMSNYYHELSKGYQHYQQCIKRYKTKLKELYQRYQHTPSDEDLAIIDELCQAFDQYRILTATKRGRLGVVTLNEVIEQQFRGVFKSSWYLGKAVMITQNNPLLGLANGDIGLCLSGSRDQFMVYFPHLSRWLPASRLPQTIQPAFAMTIHKSQGSEFEHVAVVLDDAEHLLSQELLYTAITRAKQYLQLLTTKTALELALTQKTQRTSRLVHKVENLIQSLVE